MSNNVDVAKSAPIKLSAFLYPDEGLLLAMDGTHHYKLFAANLFAVEKVDEVEGRTYIESNPSTTATATMIANVVCADRKLNDAN